MPQVPLRGVSPSSATPASTSRRSTTTSNGSGFVGRVLEASAVFGARAEQSVHRDGLQLVELLRHGFGDDRLADADADVDAGPAPTATIASVIRAAAFPVGAASPTRSGRSIVGSEQRGEEAGDRVGLAGARPADDDGERRRQRQSARRRAACSSRAAPVAAACRAADRVRSATAGSVAPARRRSTDATTPSSIHWRCVYSSDPCSTSGRSSNTGVSSSRVDHADGAARAEGPSPRLRLGPRQCRPAGRDVARRRSSCGGCRELAQRDSATESRSTHACPCRGAQTARHAPARPARRPTAHRCRLPRCRATTAAACSSALRARRRRPTAAALLTSSGDEHGHGARPSVGGTARRARRWCAAGVATRTRRAARRRPSACRHRPCRARTGRRRRRGAELGS